MLPKLAHFNLDLFKTPGCRQKQQIIVALPQESCRVLGKLGEALTRYGPKLEWAWWINSCQEVAKNDHKIR